VTGVRIAKAAVAGRRVKEFEKKATTGVRAALKHLRTDQLMAASRVPAYGCLSSRKDLDMPPLARGGLQSITAMYLGALLIHT